MCRNLAFVAMYVNFTEKRPIMLITMKVSANVAGLCIPNVSTFENLEIVEGFVVEIQRTIMNRYHIFEIKTLKIFVYKADKFTL